MLAVGWWAAFPLAAHRAVSTRAGGAGVRGVIPGLPGGSLSAFVQAACRGRCSHSATRTSLASFSLPTVQTYLHRSGSTPAWWGASTRRRGRACADSARRRRCRCTSGSCRPGGGSARRACSSAARTRSPRVELKGTFGHTGGWPHLIESIIYCFINLLIY